MTRPEFQGEAMFSRWNPCSHESKIRTEQGKISVIQRCRPPGMPDLADHKETVRTILGFYGQTPIRRLQHQMLRRIQPILIG